VLKVVFVNRFFFPDHSATSQLLSDFCFFLANKGFEIHVVASQQLYEDPGARLSSEEDVFGVKVHRVWTSRFGRQRLFLRAIDYLTYYLATGWYLLNLASRNDIVVAKTDPPMISVVAWIIAGIKGARLVNWVQDLFPEVAYAIGGGKINRFGRMLGWLRNGSLRDASLNIAIGSKMAKRIAGFGVQDGKVQTVHNWADGGDISPCEKNANPLSKAWGLCGKFVVGYSGNMGRVHEFETILRAIDRLAGKSDIVFLFIGSGAKRSWLEAKCRSWTNVLFKPYQPRDQLKFSLCVPDVHLVSLRPDMEGLIVPSKFYGIAAAGRPTIFVGDPDGEIPGILHSAECGVTVASGDATGLVRAIVMMKEDPTLSARMGHNARQAFERDYDKAVALPAWEQLLKDAMANG
jgi:glycosyltransferase involved in cell wall biosynthesis